MCEISHGQTVKSGKEIKSDLPDVGLILLSRRFKIEDHIQIMNKIM